MSRPQLLDSALYALLHKDDIAGFNQERPQGPIDMRGGDFRGLDLRQLNAQDVDFTDSYFRSADLRGVDLRTACIEGASLAHAQISGAYFPVELTADEILMSVNFGTRLRYRTK
ncbi:MULTISPECIES: pentapeptide repeat-containing protein [Pseudomonas]|uniref:pentapeptide repeat-containing protein n=1 Tax=Pseudomonas TaxID=286 RepID=UPI0006418A41|nr:pentapeptide repeat-containing protein [Pseudomonas lundensis]NLU02722.1 pentapeptide repeat-containing protein [Pseudomonas lundensis]NNA02388.1 pentapeptide repeat-containing protein [Pseudomonas lundensis]NNA07576.1 pentapeptide repeat-containing protein [Pseudomonas lundensis]NNA31775.1 pentapeptide repeat-containing protein [Pseudomonas lundensis]NNA41205.1 pentapeptide repeat-containing protein [Pseudomonas lundensis]